MSDVSVTKEVHEFTGTFASLSLYVITVDGETDGLETLEQAYLLCRIHQTQVSFIWIWLSESRLGVLDIIIFDWDVPIPSVCVGR